MSDLKHTNSDLTASVIVTFYFTCISSVFFTATCSRPTSADHIKALRYGPTCLEDEILVQRCWKLIEVGK